MALLREHTADDYWADHGILVVRDQGGPGDPGDPGDPGYEDAGLLAESATDTQPGGTIAHAGVGWLWARTSSADCLHTVTFEAHDGPPPDDGGAVALAGWDDVMETPFRSGTGMVALGLITGGEYEQHTLLLGQRGDYRVRVSCRRQPDEIDDADADAGDVEGDTWRLQFWPVPDDPAPPRWLARGGPAVCELSYEWDEVLDPQVRDVLWAARGAVRGHPQGASAAQVAAAKPAQADGDETSPDTPLWPPLPRPPLTTGHPDRDAFEAQLHAELLAERAERERALAEMAARCAVPAPVTVGDVLPLFARLGLLTVRRDGDEARYLVPAEQPRVRDVLDLPAQRLAAIDEQQMFHRYCAPATDLVAVAIWTPAGRVGTVADLARRVLMQTSDVRAVLGYARRRQLLRVDGDDASPADDDASQLTLTVLPRSARESAGQQRLEVPGFADVPHVIEPISPVDSDAMGKEYAQGPPPSAGIVTTSGTLVIWRDGAATVLAEVSGDVQRAVATPHGIVVLGLSRCVLVGPDGRAEVLATNTNFRGAVSADGRYLALAQARYGRRPAFSLQVIDLADRSPQILRWPENPTVAGVYGDTVYFSSDTAGGLRWTPGSDPEPLPWTPRTVDSRTGVMLVDGEAAGADGWLVIGARGERANVLVTLTADLAPGGTHLIDFRYSPPAVTLFDVAAGGADPRVWWLPEGCDMSMPCGPAWEDAGHLLLRRPYSGGTPAVRLDVRTGDIEGVSLPGIEGYEVAAFVESPG